MNQEVQMMPPQKTWFFEDTRGRIFSTNEKEADSILHTSSKWRQMNLKMIGMSDGTTFHKKVKEGTARVAELERDVKLRKEVIDRYIKTEDKLIFEEVVEEDDDRLKRVREKIETLQKELEPLEKEYKDLRSHIIKKAEEAELEKARGNLVMPKRFTVVQKGDKIPGAESAINALTQ